MTDFTNYERFAPKDAGIANSKGICFQGLGDHQNAVNLFSQAISYDGSMGIFYLNRAISSYYLGNLDQARSDAISARNLQTPVDPGFLQAPNTVFKNHNLHTSLLYCVYDNRDNQILKLIVYIQLRRLAGVIRSYLQRV